MSSSMFCAMTHVPRMFEEGTLYMPPQQDVSAIRVSVRNYMYSQWEAHGPFSEIVKGRNQERGRMQSIWKINNRSV